MTIPPPPVAPTSSMIRPALALLAGLGITALIVGPGVIIATLAMLRDVAAPRDFVPTTPYLVATLAINAVGAFAGGLATARITVGRSFYTVFLLSLILFMSAMVVVLRGAGEGPARPRWSLITQAIVVLVASLLGGWLERRREAAR
jgi:hypothetical protein